MLQDCFDNTDWNMFRDSTSKDSSINIEEYTVHRQSQVSLGNCVDDVVPTITTWLYHNQIPWMNRDILAGFFSSRHLQPVPVPGCTPHLL